MKPAIRPDIHRRFRAIVERVDAAIAAEPAESFGAPTLFGVEAKHARGRRLPGARTDNDPTWDGVVGVLEDAE